MNIAFSQTAMDRKASMAMRELAKSPKTRKVCNLCKALQGAAFWGAWATLGGVALALQCVAVFCLTFSMGLLLFPLMG